MHIYLERGAPALDGARIRKRLSSLFRDLNLRYTVDNLAQAGGFSKVNLRLPWNTNRAAAAPSAQAL